MWLAIAATIALGVMTADVLQRYRDGQVNVLTLALALLVLVAIWWP